jgi:hypothetical protein
MNIGARTGSTESVVGVQVGVVLEELKIRGKNRFCDKDRGRNVVKC